MNKVENASQMPQVYFGLHMVEGVAEYREPDKEPQRIYVGEEVLKKMDQTFPGKPVYVDHVDAVDVANIEKADGYVVESFFNQTDGKHWAKFVVITDKGHEAIRKGWKLSNAYLPKAYTGGGMCHGVEYQQEVTMAEYEHLAIVNNPRYEESIILTPEKFKAYNIEKEQELLRVANSQGEKEMFQLFKKEKVANSSDIASMSVTLPKSKVEKSLTECIEIADTVQNMNGYANGDHMVKVGDDEMSVNELVKKHMNLMKKMNDDMEEEEKEKKKNAEEVPEGDREKADVDAEELALVKVKSSKKKKNEEEEKEKEEKKENDDEQEEMEKKEKMKEDKKKNDLYFDALKNAEKKVFDVVPKFELSEDKVARGKSRYGSN